MRTSRDLGSEKREKVRVGVAGFGRIDIEGSVECRVGVFIHLVDMELRAKFQGVCVDDLGDPIAEIVGVVDLHFVL